MDSGHSTGGVVNILRELLLVALLSLMICNYSDAAEEKETKPKKAATTMKGDRQEMKTFYVGRFAIDVPAEFKLAVQSQRIRYAEISDFRWAPGDREKERSTLWAQKITQIQKLPKPVDKKAALIEEVNLPSIGKWAKGILYYGDSVLTRRVFWTVLVDYGRTGVWLTIAGTNKDKMVRNFTNVLTHYKERVEPASRGSFYLNHGEIQLPYLEQEKSYARFEGHPLGLKLEIHMSEIHEKVEAGLIERLTSAIAMNFAPGLEVEKIRSTNRTINENEGEEIVLKLDEGNRRELRFGWECAGVKDSGEHPSIKIEMEGPEGLMSEKLAFWDQVVGSFRSAGR